ncbi:MAG: HAD superfamily hydrolase (TIGR01509 family) [Gammaproteobacteria bacterium]|jgi:HAD superfamily hydrolase (TIGR01509 family)
MSYHAILFDLDGLMIDTERVVLKAFRIATDELGFELPPGLFPTLVGRTAKDSSAMILDAFGADFPLETFRALTRSVYDREIDENGIGLMPGIEPMLDYLVAKKIPYACATSTANERAWWKLHKAGIGHWFETLVGGDEVEAGKPAPDIFFEAARRLGVDGDRCIVLEDSPNGVRAAAAANMTPIMVPDMVQPDEYATSLAHAIVADLHHARRLIDSMLD